MSSPLKEINTLMQKEVSRKEFLRIVGAAILGVIGVTGLIQTLSRLGGGTNSVQQEKQKSPSGYGMSAYGR